MIDILKVQAEKMSIVIFSLEGGGGVGNGYSPDQSEPIWLNPRTGGCDQRGEARWRTRLKSRYLRKKQNSLFSGFDDLVCAFSGRGDDLAGQLFIVCGPRHRDGP